MAIVKVFVETMSGRQLTLDMEKEAQIIDVKHSIAQHWGAAPFWQKLIVAGEIVEDEFKLEDICGAADTGELNVALVFNSSPASSHILQRVDGKAIRWAQRKDSLLVTLDHGLGNLAHPWLQVDEDGELRFVGVTRTSRLDTSLRLHGPVDRDALKVRANEREVRLYMKKSSPGFWPSLTHQKDTRVSIDWLNWADSDDEDEKGNFNEAGMLSVPRPL